MFNDDLRGLLQKYQIKHFTAAYKNPVDQNMLMFFFNPTVSPSWTANSAAELAKTMNRLKSQGKLGKGKL